MLSKLKHHHNKRYQPLSRVGHHSVLVNDSVYVWGGWNKTIPKQHSTSEKVTALSAVDVFSYKTCSWDQVPTQGIPPMGVAYYASTAINEDVYFFGGRCGHGGCHHNTLHRLNTLTMKWKDATPPYSQSSEDGGPMKKAQCGMVHLKWNSDLLLIVGGYGLLPPRHQPQATYLPKRGNPEYGWTNECHLFNIEQGSWIIPEVTGDQPPPCSNFSMISIGPSRAAMYGGFQPEGKRLSDIYIAELLTNGHTIHWCKLSPVTFPASLKLKGSCDQSMEYISGYHSDDGHTPCILVQGGENDEGETLSDCWIMELKSAEWRQVSLPSSVAKRMYHSLSTITIGPYSVLMIMFGGVSKLDDLKDWQDQIMLANTTIIEIVKRPDDYIWSSNVLYEANDQSKTAYDDYIKKLNNRMFQCRNDWLTIVNQDDGLLPSLQERDRALRAEQRADIAEQQAIESRKKAEETQNIILTVKEAAKKDRRESVSLNSELSETRQRLKESLEELERVKNELHLSNERITVLEQDTKRDEGMHSHSTISTDSGVVSVTMDTTANDWSLSLDEVVYQIEETLGVSPYSGVYVKGQHIPSGTSVSVKVLDPSFLSEEAFVKMVHQIQQIRHSNILLFLGAVSGDVPLIIYELLPSKPLSALLADPLPHTSISTISIDLCQALAYLHHKSLVHSMVCSQVVFIEHLSEGICAKLADAGLFPYYKPLQDTTGVTVDVCGFGVLLIEMCRGKELESSSQSEREDEVQYINWSPMVDIIRSCIDDTALTMIDILTSLKEL